MTTTVPAHIAELATAVAAQAEALAAGNVPVPTAAARRLAANAETLLAWCIREDEGLPASRIALTAATEELASIREGK